jgi:soluble epoxide hydrolase / lipid-phosphate phosphatase
MPVDTFNRRTATVTRDDGSEYTYSFIDENPHDGTSGRATILAIHGFPDLAITYSHQIKAWTAAGYRVIVPDCLGYGDTVRTHTIYDSDICTAPDTRGQDKPEDPKAYNIKKMTGDLKQILDQVLGEDWKVVVVGYGHRVFLLTGVVLTISTDTTGVPS